MTNQRDDGFNDKPASDDIFASDDDPMNETFDAHRLQDVVDVDTDDVTADISDYDDNDDGIFAPPVEKKKSSSALLFGTVAAIALVAAGGFAFYKNPDLIASLTGSGTVDAPEEILAQTAPAETPPEVASTDIAPVGETDAELAAIPQPQAIANIAQDIPAAEAPPVEPVAQTTPPETTEVVPAAPVEPAAATPAPPVAEVIPAPPSPSESQSAVVAAAEPAEPVPEPAAAVPAPDTPVTIAKSPAPNVNITTTKTPVIDLTGDAPSAPPQPAAPSLKPVPDVAMNDPVITANIQAAPKVVPQTVYYDAPKGKAMTGIPTPSMNPKRGDTGNESIIIVGKVGDRTVTAKNQDSGVVSATRALRLGRYDAAIEMFDNLYRANPRDGRILMGRAVTLQKLGRTKEAIEAYEEALTVDPDNPEAIVNLMGLIRKQYPARALEKLLELRASHPNNPGIMAQLGIAYADSGNLEDAVKYLQLASQAEPNNPQHYYNLAIISERMKNRVGAIGYYEKALETDAVYGTGRGIDRDRIYDRLTRLRG